MKKLKDAHVAALSRADHVFDGRSGRSTASAVSADANGGEGTDLVLGQGDVHGVGLDPGHGPDRDGHLLPSPEVAAFEDEVRDVLGRVNHEAVHLAQ